MAGQGDTPPNRPHRPELAIEFGRQDLTVAEALGWWTRRVERFDRDNIFPLQILRNHQSIVDTALGGLLQTVPTLSLIASGTSRELGKSLEGTRGFWETGRPSQHESRGSSLPSTCTCPCWKYVSARNEFNIRLDCLYCGKVMAK